MAQFVCCCFLKTTQNKKKTTTTITTHTHTHTQCWSSTLEHRSYSGMWLTYPFLVAINCEQLLSYWWDLGPSPSAFFFLVCSVLIIPQVILNCNHLSKVAVQLLMAQHLSENGSLARDFFLSYPQFPSVSHLVCSCTQSHGENVVPISVCSGLGQYQLPTLSFLPSEKSQNNTCQEICGVA